MIRIITDGNNLHFIDKEEAAAVLKMAGKWAADPAIDFTWLDAARLSKRVNRDPVNFSQG